MYADLSKNIKDSYGTFKIKFYDDPGIVRQTVNHTCERCGIFDCQERVAAPVLLQKERLLSEMKQAIKGLWQTKMALLFCL